MSGKADAKTTLAQSFYADGHQEPSVELPPLSAAFLINFDLKVGLVALRLALGVISLIGCTDTQSRGSAASTTVRKL